MPPRRRIKPDEGASALGQYAAGDHDSKQIRATAVRYTLEELMVNAPGRCVEVRVPPYGAIQCIEGPTHTRGTPPNVVETDAPTWLALVLGDTTWEQARAAGAIRASGHRADLREYLPMFGTDEKK